MKKTEKKSPKKTAAKSSAKKTTSESSSTNITGVVDAGGGKYIVTEKIEGGGTKQYESDTNPLEESE